MAKISQRGRKAQLQTRRKPLAPKKTRDAPAKVGDATLKQQLTESRAQQAATAEILKVISGSPADTQPVFEAIVKNAHRLVGAVFSILYRFDGKILSVLADSQSDPKASAVLRGMYPAPARRGAIVGRTVLDGREMHTADILADARFPANRNIHVKVSGYRAALAVPLLQDGKVIGAVAAGRLDPRAFNRNEIRLLRTFADQAVIALRNASFFKEIQDRNAELKQSLEFQGASGEILSAISSSIADAQPVFDSIVRSLCSLFHTRYAVLALLREGKFELKAFSGEPGFAKNVRAAYPFPADDDRFITVSAVRTRKVVQLCPIVGNPRAPVKTAELAKKNNYNSIITAPLLRKGAAIGYIVTTRAKAVPFDDKQVALIKAFADQAVIAIENVRLFNETKEALEQQTAISEILRVISGSPTDVQPVLEAVAQRAARICDASDARIFLVEGDKLRHTAGFGDVPFTIKLGDSMPLDRGSVVGRAVVDRVPVHIEDVNLLPAGEFPLSRKIQKHSGWRTNLGVPLLREDRALGAITLRRIEARPFTERQIALLKTFADQAAIAIENVRLFNETKEALERQTATGEILASMSGSMTETKPVFDAIVRSLLRLFGTSFAVVSLLRDGKLELAGFKGEPGFEKLAEFYPLPLDEKTIAGEVILTGQVTQYAPVVDNRAVPPVTEQFARQFGMNALIAAPMIREGKPIGVVITAHRDAMPFNDKQVALLKSFADQAVIAIENVRLFKELESRTEALTRSVGQLTALGEVGQAISSTLDLETVLKAIVSRAIQLTGLDAGVIYEYDERGEQFQLRASENLDEESVAALRGLGIRKGEGAVGTSVVRREPTQVPDTHAPGYSARLRELLDRSGYRALLAVPLLREDHVIGALTLIRKVPGPFSPEIVELLKTFSAQSALAIQNARLFREIAEKGKQLEVASQHKSQFLASMSHELRTPLNAILGFNEMILDQVYGEVSADVRAPLENMQTSGRHLLRLINNVLDLAKIEAGRMELSLQDYSAHDIVENVRATLRSLAESKGLELGVSVPADLPLAYGDAGRITQCLMNLAGNSLKFTKEGRVDIAVELKGGTLLLYRVADTGIGIPPDKIDSLFTEFKQTDATIASEYGGTGLGLSITKKFIEMHSGRIWVESEIGKGSTFLFEVPLRVAQ